MKKISFKMLLEIRNKSLTELYVTNSNIELNEIFMLN